MVLVPQREVSRARTRPSPTPRGAVRGPARHRSSALFAAISAARRAQRLDPAAGRAAAALRARRPVPARFARRRGAAAPVFALVSTSLLVTALVLMNFGSSMVEVFTFMTLLSTTANLVAYLACSLRSSRCCGAARREPPRRRWLAATAALGALFSLWAIAGAGRGPSSGARS